MNTCGADTGWDSIPAHRLDSSMVATTIAACVGAAMLLGIGAIVILSGYEPAVTRRRKHITLTVGLLLVVVGPVLGAATIHRFDRALDEAATTVEDRYGVTVDRVGNPDPNKPSLWVIDGSQRHCYLTHSTASGLRLLCATGDAYVEVLTQA